MYFSVQVSPTFTQNSQSFVNKKMDFVYFMEIGEFVCVIVTSELTFDSGGVCCYKGSESKTKRL